MKTGMMESWVTAIAHLLPRNILTSVLLYADKSFLDLAQRCKLLEYIRCLVTTLFLFCLRFLPSFITSLDHHHDFRNNPTLKPLKNESYPPICRCGDSGVARALSQLLSIVNDIPVSSRKYDVVRSLAERLIDDNNREDAEVLHEVNRVALSAAFTRTLGQLESAVMDLGFDRAENDGLVSRPVPRLNRVLKAVWSVGEGALVWAGRHKDGVNRLSGSSAEKLVAELLWLAKKMVACGFGKEAVDGWASASNLAWLALSAEPRLQGSLVKASVLSRPEAKYTI
uniref:Uncharacterized protein n=1 Tax=Rhizophora mucronata TaxID=61149 RepID=A0A2P2JS32_RHIMU